MSNNATADVISVRLMRASSSQANCLKNLRFSSPVSASVEAISSSVRWCGEEFVVLLSNVDMEKALSVCDRLRSSIEDHVVIVDGQPVSVTASFGLAMLPPNSDFDDMLEQADGALYESKAKGRNCVTAVKELTLAA